MFCKNCGNQLNDHAAFCPKCGTRIITQENEKPGEKMIYPADQIQKPKKRTGLVLFLSVIIIIAGISVSVVILFFKEKDGAGKILAEYLDGQESKTEEMQEESSVYNIEAEMEAEDEQEETDLDTDTNMEQEVVIEKDPYEVFGITQGRVENYAENLDTNTYQYYNSGVSRFRFFYPADLYGEVRYSDEETASVYGINMKTIDFVGSAGSELTFSLYYYEDGMSIEEISEKIYNTEKAGLLDASDVIYGTFEDHGRIIVTGRTGDDLKMVYDLFYVDSEYVMQMKIIFPAYQGIEDKFQKDYVTECLYRLCGFSGSTANCRSYEAYKAESMDLETEIEQIRERYYSVQDRLNDMEIAGTDDVNVYIDEGNIYKIVAAKGTWGVDCTREYSFIDGRLYFAFVYDGSSERRFYFVDDMLIRYINENSEIYDLEDADFYTQFASEYQREAYRLLDEMGG